VLDDLHSKISKSSKVRQDVTQYVNKYKSFTYIYSFLQYPYMYSSTLVQYCFTADFLYIEKVYYTIGILEKNIVAQCKEMIIITDNERKSPKDSTMPAHGIRCLVLQLMEIFL